LSGLKYSSPDPAKENANQCDSNSNMDPIFIACNHEETTAIATGQQRGLSVIQAFDEAWKIAAGPTAN
jgi:hypothetical protein